MKSEFLVTVGVGLLFIISYCSLTIAGKFCSLIYSVTQYYLRLAKVNGSVQRPATYVLLC